MKSNFVLLEALEALLSTCSVTEAAKRMHLSPPAMSHTLARIREVMGDPILVRAGRGLVPTPRALELVDPLRQAIAQVNALFTQVTDQGLTSVNRTFVIRAPEGVSVVFGAPLALVLEEIMPNARVQFVPEQHGDTSALREGRIDLDIGTMHHRDPETEIVPLAEQTLVGAVRTGHPLLQSRITVARYAAERHVVATAREMERSAVDVALTSYGHERFVAIAVHSSHAALVVAARSQLVATVPEPMARGMQAFLGLEIFELPLDVPKVPIILAWHPRNYLDRIHRALRDSVRRVLDSENWKLPSLAVSEVK